VVSTRLEATSGEHPYRLMASRFDPSVRGALQTISGLLLAVGLLVFGWQLAGRPSVDCGSIGSGFQAVGAAVELWAVLLIVWKPWIRPRLDKVRSAAAIYGAKIRTRFRRWRPGVRSEPQRITLTPATEHDAAGSLTIRGGGRATAAGETLETQVKEVQHRVALLESRLEQAETKLTERLAALSDKVKSESAGTRKVIEKRVADLETQAISVRTNDALRLFLGISLTLVGAAWGTYC
jgi:hypothetical protein